MTTAELVQTATLALAVLGAVLGVINTLHALDKTRVKLKVRPAHAIPIGAAPSNIGLSIEVTNLGAIPVTICEVGVLYRGTDSRGFVAQPIFADNGAWPRRLEPRSSLTAYCQRPDSRPGHRIKCAYAKTQCGVTTTGTSPALRQMANGEF